MPTASLLRVVFLIFVMVILISFLASQPQAENPCPDPPVPNISSSAIPADVCIPTGFANNPIAFFDDFSWRSFIALVWPVRDGERGMADDAQDLTAPKARVFETYKAGWELFHNDGSVPGEWNKYDTTNACSEVVTFGDLVLASFSKFSDIGQAGFGNLVGPLVAQNITYVRYLTGINKLEFDQILRDKLYLRENLPELPNVTKFLDGALDVKSAWIEMKNIPHHERYYTRIALVLDPETGLCSKKEVGLVGLHIVQKTPTRPQWVWSTFEHVDNVPPAAPGAPGTLAFNDGSNVPMPDKNPYGPVENLITPVPPPFNVQRLKPIDSSTHDTNTKYQDLLKQKNSIWQFYKLVMTQWPVPPSRPDLDGSPKNTFPGTGSDQTAFSNITMETFDQKDIKTGCMNCHNQSRETDFLWALNNHAFPPNVPNLLFKDPSFKKLKELLKKPQEH